MNLPCEKVRGLGGVGGVGRPDEVMANGAHCRAAEVDGWKRFPPEMRSLDVPRADMPQIKAEHRGAMVNFLNARGIEHSEELDVSPGTLRPTQAEYSPAKIEQARAFTGGNRAILVSADNRILDGHHQWAQALQDDKPIRIIRLKAPITQLLNTVKEFPSATTDDSSAAAASPAPAPAPDAGPGAAAADAADGRAGEIGPSGGPVAADAEGAPSADVAPPAAGQGSGRRCPLGPHDARRAPRAADPEHEGQGQGHRPRERPAVGCPGPRLAEDRPARDACGGHPAPAAAPVAAPSGAAQEARDNSPVVQFGRAMRSAGLELDGLDPRKWSIDLGSGHEVQARLSLDNGTVFVTRFAGGTVAQSADVPYGAEASRMVRDFVAVAMRARRAMTGRQ